MEGEGVRGGGQVGGKGERGKGGSAKGEGWKRKAANVILSGSEGA